MTAQVPSPAAPFVKTEAEYLARMHEKAFPEFFLSRLGMPFLKQFYLGFLRDPSAVVAVCRDRGGRITAVAVGTTEPCRFFRRLLFRRLPGFLLASLTAAIGDPRVIPRLLSGATYRGGTREQRAGALLSSICVDPLEQGHGLGRAVLAKWIIVAKRLGASQASLLTDAVGNEGANHFYQAAGWELAGREITKEGREMNRYQIAFSSPSTGGG